MRPAMNLTQEELDTFSSMHEKLHWRMLEMADIAEEMLQEEGKRSPVFFMQYNLSWDLEEEVIYARFSEESGDEGTVTLQLKWLLLTDDEWRALYRKEIENEEEKRRALAEELAKQRKNRELAELARLKKIYGE